MKYFAFVFVTLFLLQINSANSDAEKNQISQISSRGILSDWVHGKFDNFIPNLYENACKFEESIFGKIFKIFFTVFDKISGGRLAQITDQGEAVFLRIAGVSLKLFKNVDGIVTKLNKLVDFVFHHKPSNSSVAKPHRKPQKPNRPKPGKENTTPNSIDTSSEKLATSPSSGQINLSTEDVTSTTTPSSTDPSVLSTVSTTQREETASTYEEPTTSPSPPTTTTEDAPPCCDHPAEHWSLPFPGPGPWIPITADGVPINPNFN